jgi:hypothetical protein
MDVTQPAMHLPIAPITDVRFACETSGMESRWGNVLSDGWLEAESNYVREDCALTTWKYTLR